MKFSASYRPLVIGLLVIMVSGLLASLSLLNQQQDLRQQAASCSEAPVDVQFRKSGNSSAPWVSGNVLNAKVGDKIDVNCFSRNGAALLSGGKLKATLKYQGSTININLGAGAEVRNFTVGYPGTYTFSCSNSTSCSNSDAFTVAAETPPPNSDQDDDIVPPPVTDPPPVPDDDEDTQTPTCTTYSLSDLNKDCQTTIEDYDLFLQDFRMKNGT